MVSNIANDVIDSAEAVFANRHDRRFGNAVRSFAGLIAQVTDGARTEWSYGTLAALRHVSEQVVRNIEARLEETHDPARAQQGLIDGMNEIRRVLGAIGRIERDR
jgi:phage-related protein